MKIVAMRWAATISRISLKEMGINRPWKWRLTYPKQSRWGWLDHGMTNFRMTVRDDCAVFWSPLLLSVKTLVHWLLAGEREVSLQTEVPSTPLLPLLPFAGIQNKANFPLHQPCIFTDFWVACSQTALHILLVLVSPSLWSQWSPGKILGVYIHFWV